MISTLKLNCFRCLERHIGTDCDVVYEVIYFYKIFDLITCLLQWVTNRSQQFFFNFLVLLRDTNRGSKN